MNFDEAESKLLAACPAGIGCTMKRKQVSRKPIDRHATRQEQWTITLEHLKRPWVQIVVPSEADLPQAVEKALATMAAWQKEDATA
jgi:hypothetical protein